MFFFKFSFNIKDYLIVSYSLQCFINTFSKIRREPFNSLFYRKFLASCRIRQSQQSALFSELVLNGLLQLWSFSRSSSIMSMVVESQEGVSENGLLSGPPQELMEELDMQGTQGTVVKINRFGTAFAIGTSCGSILIYDYTTKLLVVVRGYM